MRADSSAPLPDRHRRAFVHPAGIRIKRAKPEKRALDAEEGYRCEEGMGFNYVVNHFFLSQKQIFNGEMLNSPSQPRSDPKQKQQLSWFYYELFNLWRLFLSKRGLALKIHTAMAKIHSKGTINVFFFFFFVNFEAVLHLFDALFCTYTHFTV